MNSSFCLAFFLSRKFGIKWVDKRGQIKKITNLKFKALPFG